MLKQTEKYFSKSFYSLIVVVMLCGFDTSRHSIPLDDIYDGGPGKDGIPVILKPKFISVKEADRTLLKKDDRVLGYVHNGQARAYPIKILNWHEIVNDRVGGASQVVTYCPLCGTGMVFDTEVKGRQLADRFITIIEVKKPGLGHSGIPLEFRACSTKVICCFTIIKRKASGRKSNRRL